MAAPYFLYMYLSSWDHKLSVAMFDPCNLLITLLISLMSGQFIVQLAVTTLPVLCVLNLSVQKQLRTKKRLLIYGALASAIVLVIQVCVPLSVFDYAHSLHPCPLWFNFFFPILSALAARIWFVSKAESELLVQQ